MLWVEFCVNKQQAEKPRSVPSSETTFSNANLAINVDYELLQTAAYAKRKLPQHVRSSQRMPTTMNPG